MTAGLADNVRQLVILVPYYFVSINVFLFIFNLLPVPPLDGWKVLGGLVSSQMSWQMRNLERQYAQIIPLIFLAFILLERRADHRTHRRLASSGCSSTSRR